MVEVKGVGDNQCCGQWGGWCGGHHISSKGLLKVGGGFLFELRRWVMTCIL